MSQSQKLTLLNKITNSISRKRYRESRSPTVSSRGVDAQVSRKPKKRKSGSSTAFIGSSTGFVVRFNFYFYFREFWFKNVNIQV